jgi:predicted MFS family arabinose efflux permease
MSWRGRTFASLRNSRNYRLYFYGQSVSLAGTWMQDAALPWLVLQETGSAFDVGVLIFCRFMPTLVLGLYSGVLADRFDNRRLLIATQFVSMAVASALAVMALGGWTPVPAIFALATLGGTALAFEGPNRHALTYQLVGPESLANAVSLNSSLFNAGRAVGPAAGGATIALAGVGWCFVFNALSFLAILVALLLMHTTELYPVKRSSRGTRALAAVREGLAFVRRSPPALAVIGLMLVGSVVGFNFRVLVPVLAEQTLHAGAGTFGALYACFGIGALAGALASASIGRASARAFLVGSFTLNGAVLAIAPVRSTLLAAVLLLIAGGGFSTWVSMGQSILQLSSPDQLRGRVISLYLLVFGGLQPLGALLAGWLTEAGGTGLAYALSGGLGLAGTAFAAMRLRGVVVTGPLPTADAVG